MEISPNKIGEIFFLLFPCFYEQDYGTIKSQKTTYRPKQSFGLQNRVQGLRPCWGIGAKPQGLRRRSYGREDCIE